MFASIAANASAAVHAKVRANARTRERARRRVARVVSSDARRASRWGFDARARWGRDARGIGRDDRARARTVEDNFTRGARARDGGSRAREGVFEAGDDVG